MNEERSLQNESSKRPAFVVERVQAQLLLLMCGHLSVDHTKSLFSAMSTLPLSDVTLRAELLFFSVLFNDVVALPT